MRKVRLGEIAELKTGPFGTQFSASEYVANGTPMINVGDIGYGEVITDSLKKVSHTTIKRLSEHLVHEGDIVFGRKGSVDRHAYIDKDKDGWLQGSDCIRVRCDAAVNSRYVSHFLKLPYARKQMLSGCVGSTMPSLNTDILKDMIVFLPDRDIQDRIEAIFSAIDSKIETNSKVIAELEALARTVYDYWFTQFDFPDEHGNPYRSSGGPMVHNPTLNRDIPAGWEIGCVGDFLQLLKGYSYNSDELSDDGMPMINLASVTREQTYKPSGLKYLSHAPDTDRTAKAGDMLIACTDLTRNAEIVGSPIFVPEHYDEYVYSMDLAKVKISEGLLPGYLYMQLRTPNYRNYIRGFASGTNVLHLDVNGIGWYKIPIPPLSIQKEFNDIICSYRDDISRCMKESARLASLRDWLLPMLMNGQAVV